MGDIETPSETPAEPVELTDEAADEAFDAGFAGVAGTPEAATPEVPPAPETPAAPVEVVPEPPKLAEITEEAWKGVQTGTTELKGVIEKERRDVFGKIGSLEQIVKSLQASTPSGEPVTVAPDDLVALREAGFPDLAESLAKDLTKVMSRLKGTGAPAAVVPATTPIDIETLAAPFVQKQVTLVEEKLRRERAIERLADKHENWEEIVGPDGSTTEYRTWLKSLGAAEEARVLNTWNPREASKSIDSFLDFKKKQTTKPPVSATTSSRSQRFADAVQPKGTSGSGPTKQQLTDDEQFEAGFKTARG